MMYREEILLRKQRVASLSREEEAGGGKGGGGGCVTHSLTLMERAETAGEKGKKRREKERETDAASERNCVGGGDGEHEESLLARLHG